MAIVTRGKPLAFSGPIKHRRRLLVPDIQRYSVPKKGEKSGALKMEIKRK